MSNLPKMLSKREIELEELEEAKYVQSLRDDIEKLQEQNKTMKLALVELSDENIYDNTGFFADEYAKNLVEQLDAGEIETIVERCNRNLQEQLNTAKKALTEIDRSRYGMQFRRDRNPNLARQALAAIGGDDE